MTAARRVISSPDPVPEVDVGGGAVPPGPPEPPPPTFKLSTLAQIFVTERHRQRAGNVGHAPPIISEIEAEPGVEPLLTSNMKGSFVRTRVSALGGHARFAYSEVALDREADLMVEFYRVLVECAAKEGWQNIARTTPEAVQRMRGFGIQPAVVLSAVPVDEPLLWLQADLPAGCALMVGPPGAVGLHTRIGTHVGILAYRCSTAFVAVRS